MRNQVTVLIPSNARIEETEGSNFQAEYSADSGCAESRKSPGWTNQPLKKQRQRRLVAVVVAAPWRLGRELYRRQESATVTSMKKLTLRLSESLHEALKDLSQHEDRSLHGEIIYRLKRAVESRKHTLHKKELLNVE